MPNIRVPGDVEGFGIAALEAGACGLPVIASRLQGIPDAVIDGVTGHLVQERNADEFLARIDSLALDRAKIRAEVVRRFGWDKIGADYAAALMSVSQADSIFFRSQNIGRAKPIKIPQHRFRHVMRSAVFPQQIAQPEGVGIIDQAGA